MQRIHNRSHPDPIIAMGDFNAGESNPAILYLKGKKGPLGKAPLSLKDSFRILHPDEPTAGTFNSFKGATDGEKIDYVFVSPDLKVKEAAIVRFQKDGRNPSDHFPVSATIAFPPHGNP
jgi:endonuclease/exonuclease/phosphatase family metal-dependent hydrolase